MAEAGGEFGYMMKGSGQHRTCRKRSARLSHASHVGLHSLVAKMNCWHKLLLRMRMRCCTEVRLRYQATMACPESLSNLRRAVVMLLCQDGGQIAGGQRILTTEGLAPGSWLLRLERGGNNERMCVRKTQTVVPVERLYYMQSNTIHVLKHDNYKAHIGKL